MKSALALVALAGAAHADPTSGVDGVLFRGSYDSNGIFAVEGARLLPEHDLSLKLMGGFARSPIDVAVPGIGDAGDDRILDYLVTLDLAFGMTVTDRVAIGFDLGAYRTSTGDGYGVRGRFEDDTKRSTGLIALRPLSNIDPSANPDDRYSYLGDGIAGPLDARAGIKVKLVEEANYAIAAVGSIFLPFGEDEMLLGDHDLVFEPKLAAEWRPDKLRQTRVVGNLAGRFRSRTVLEGYDPAMETVDDAHVFLDVGSEAVVSAGGVYELAPRTTLAAEAQLFVR